MLAAESRNRWAVIHDLGVARLLVGQTGEAEVALRAGLEAAPAGSSRLASAWWLGVLLQRDGRTDEADELAASQSTDVVAGDPFAVLLDLQRHRIEPAAVRATLVADWMEQIAGWATGAPAPSRDLLERLRACAAEVGLD